MNYNQNTEKRISRILDSAKDQNASDFSPIVERAIVAAASERSSLELKQKAWLLVYNGLRSYIFKNVNHYAFNGNIEDYLNDFFIIIMQNLERWRPKQGKLITFFAPWIEKSCNMTQFKEQTFSSMYYRDLYLDIVKTTNELIAEKNGEIPTEKEIHASLKAKGCKRSMKSIKETMEQNVHIVSLDAPNEEENCLLDTLTAKKEKNIKVEATWKTIEAMNPTHRVILEAEYRFYSDENNYERKKMQIKELYKECEPHFGDVSLSWLRKQRHIAERAFMHKYHEMERIIAEAG